MDEKDYLIRLNEISRKKLSLMEELLLFNRSQREAIQAGRFEDLQSLINEKQLRMDAVDKLDEQFMVYTARLKGTLSINSFDDLPKYKIPGTVELKEITLRIHEKIAEIKSIEDENNDLVKKELKDTGEKINHNNTFKRVTGAYYPVKNDIPSYYFDKKK